MAGGGVEVVERGVDGGLISFAKALVVESKEGAVACAVSKQNFICWAWRRQRQFDTYCC